MSEQQAQTVDASQSVGRITEGAIFTLTNKKTGREVCGCIASTCPCGQGTKVLNFWHQEICVVDDVSNAQTLKNGKTVYSAGPTLILAIHPA